MDVPGFAVGENLAATPGRVVFRNELMELLQYAPQTTTVFRVPLLISPSWTRKYYIMDLSPGRSFAEWAVRQGHTVFAISYRNPDVSMRNVALDDYLLHGPHTALDVIADITRVTECNVVGHSLGGTLIAILLGYGAATGEEERVQSATLVNTELDFSAPDPIGFFIDRESIERLCERFLKRGFVDATLGSTFWNYLPTASGTILSDVEAWNADVVRIPADMASFFLRYCYVENELARGMMTLAGRRLRLNEVTTDVYAMASANDYMATWESFYSSASLLAGYKRFVLSSSGELASVVNPPSSPSQYRTTDGEDLASSPSEWLADATDHHRSWWEDWADWAATRAGKRRRPPGLGSNRFPAVADAPGVYVFEH